MFIPWFLFLISAVLSHEIETIPPNPNVTTLYPTNKTITRNDSETKPSEKFSPQTWKFEASLTSSNLTEEKERTQEEENNFEDSKEAKLEKESKEEIKEFKPSQHLGSFFDEDTAELIRTPIVGPVVKKPAGGFVSSITKDYSYNKIPENFFKTYKQFPYKYHEGILTKIRPNWQEEPLDSKPTVEAPVSLPAGGLYKSPVSFREKPSSGEGFGSDISDEAKEHNMLKKRESPWQNILRLVTAFIPVGLIISALTPSVINIQNVDGNRDPAGFYRRSDPGVSEVAPISEQCRRRLLCELHSERYYTTPSSTRRYKAKLCYKIHCEDTEALWRMLRWLFTYNQLPSEEHRGRYVT